jgi:hypothetical protein
MQSYPLIMIMIAVVNTASTALGNKLTIVLCIYFRLRVIHGREANAVAELCFLKDT